MVKNYLKVAIRNILKHKGFSIINIVGLAIGIACSILILIFVAHELSYDKFHEKADRTYRIAVRASVGDTKIRQTYSSSATFKKLLEDFPEIEVGVKFLNLGRTPVKLGEITFYESRFFALDSTFFDVFTFPLIHGNPKTALSEPNSMVVSKNTALKYFGSTDAVGKILRSDFSYGPGSVDFEITGVSENVPDNSHFHYDLLVSSSTFPTFINDPGWSSNNFITYVVLKEGTTAEWFNERLKEFTRRYMGGERFDAWVAKGNFWEYFLQPLTKIHLNSDLNGEFEANGNETYVYIFSAISIIILLIACINFMNLSTAKSSLRAKEVGMRKVVGSGRGGLVFQFLSESVLLSFISLTIGMVLVIILLPLYKNLIGRQLEIHYFDNLVAIPSLLALGLIVGVISGSYPAFFLSSFKPITALKGMTIRSKGGSWLRNILVIFQFMISIFLIIGTLAVNQQLKFFQNKKLGFDKEQVLVIRNPGALGNNITPFKEALRKYSSIIDVSGSNTLPGKSFSNIGFGAEGVDKSFTLNLCVCDYDFLETLKLELAQGRFFSRDFVTDSHAAVLNEKAVELLGWDDPIGKKINNWARNRGDFTVIGVIKDYHYESLHQEIRPQALFLSDGYYTNVESYISVRLNTENISETIGYVENTWKDFAPNKPFEYSFLDEDYDNLYMNEQQTRKLFSIFSFLAIFIACLGLFGLASFIADRRTKEIGIRKVLGASVPGIVQILNKHFVKWVFIANLIAWPIAWFIMNRWLQNFAYRIELSWWMFVLAAVLALVIALITVSFQTVKAALRNPVDSLRYE
ncbi:MAG: ABC transporter permease [Candidatus Aminicenantes bacterium]|nr:ABC transporter permease [Candidatus Aminicenantes bacterium]